MRENCVSSSPKSGKNNLMVCICFKHGVFLRIQRGGKYAGPKMASCSYFVELLENPFQLVFDTERIHLINFDKSWLLNF